MTAPVELVTLAGQLAHIQDQAATLALQEAAIKTRIRELLPEPGSYPAGNVRIVVQINRRFDPDKAVELLDTNLLALVTVTTKKVDAAKTKALFPDVYEQAHTVYDSKIGLK